MEEGSLADKVAAWQRAHESVNHGQQLICCIPLRCQQSVIACKKRLAGKLHYKTSKKGTSRAKRPQFLLCLECNIWEFIMGHRSEMENE